MGVVMLSLQTGARCRPVASYDVIRSIVILNEETKENFRYNVTDEVIEFDLALFLLKKYPN